MNTTTLNTLEIERLQASRRQHQHFEFLRNVDWDFFTSSTGSKSGWVSNLSAGGCLLHTDHPIDHRRWVRVLLRETGSSSLCLMATGRVVWREDRLESWTDCNRDNDSSITLHRCGVEFIRPLNPVVIERLRELCAIAPSVCRVCRERPATVPVGDAGHSVCVLCHLRNACHSLLLQDEMEPA